MPDQNSVIAQQLSKGDVIWVPYRKDPLWPALVNNVYPKKVSYSFFPLTQGDEPKKSRFSCAPKLTYAFITTEKLRNDANDDLKKAYSAACEYLSERGRIRGANIESYGEADVKEKKKKEPKKSYKKKEKLGKRKRNEEEFKMEKDDDDITHSPAKISANSVSDSPSGSQQQPAATDEQSEAMMKLINDRLESLVNETWKTDEIINCQKQLMKDKMTIELKNNQFLKEVDYEIVFEKIINLVRSKNPLISLITAFNITASHIIPHVIISCYSSFKQLDYQIVKEIYHHQNNHVLGLDSSMSIPVTDHLEELCRLACDESDSIRI